MFVYDWKGMNVDYKTNLHFILGRRLKHILDLIVSNTQPEFMKVKNIGENTRSVFDIMAYMEFKHISRLLVLKKAFDLISWSFMYTVLICIGFGKNCIDLIKILKTTFKASVLQCGHLLAQLNIERGCRQGDSIALSLVLLCVEILSILIKHNNNIKGNFVNDKEHNMLKILC